MRTPRGHSGATVVVACFLALVAACGSGRVSDGGAADSISGVVIDVDGSLQGIDGFTVLRTDGTEVMFEPAAGATFGDEGPLSHLFDHLRNGEPVAVEYTSRDGGLVAFHVGDAG